MSTSNIFSNVFISGTVGCTTITASTQFVGPGTGLTGTASSLTSGLSSGLTGTPNITVGTVGGTTITASTQFSGPGTGLTGTAASFNVGGSAGSLSTTYTAGRILYGAGSGVPTTVSTLFYDSANGRLGIGVTNPQVLLTAVGTCTLGTGAGTTTAGYHTGMVNIIGGGTRALLRIENNNSVGSPGIIFGEGGGFTEDTQPTIKKVQGTNNLAIMCGGNVGIGTTSPLTTLHITSDKSLGPTLFAGDNTNPGQLIISGATNTNRRLGLMYDTSNNIALIQSMEYLTGAKPLILNGAGGNVGIGTTSPTAPLQISYTAPTYTAVTDATTGIGLKVVSSDGQGGIIYGPDTNHSIWLRKGRDNSTDVTDYYQYGSHRFYTGGTIQSQSLRMIINSAGNVGIGSASPRCTLDVVGSGTTAGIFANRFYLATPGDNTDSSGALNDGGPWYGLGYSVDTGLTSYIQLASFYGLALKVGSGNIVMNGGNVGIGTTNPQNKLHVSGGRTRLVAGSETYALGLSYSEASGGFYYIGATNSATPDMVFSQVGGSERMRITNAGNVGIGTASPVTNLDVTKTTAAGTPAIEIRGSGGGPRFQVYGRNADAQAWMGLGTDMGGSAYEHSIYFPNANSGSAGCATFGSYNGTTYSEKMRITVGGNVGIGVTSPSYPLHVASSVLSGTVSGRWFNQGGGLNTSTQTFITSVYAAGAFMTSDVFVAISDERVKVLEDPLSESYMDLVDKIQVHQYSWIDKIEKGERKKIGFFAQEVEKVVPDAVGQTTGVIPAIYRQANAFTETTITVTNHGITTEKKLEVVDPENGKTKIDIVRVIDADTLEVKFEKIPKDKLFVVGPEVDDSRVLNHDYLMAVSFGAVKEIIEENKSLRKQISCLTSRLDALVEQLK